MKKKNVIAVVAAAALLLGAAEASATGSHNNNNNHHNNSGSVHNQNQNNVHNANIGVNKNYNNVSNKNYNKNNNFNANLNNNVNKNYNKNTNTNNNTNRNNNTNTNRNNNTNNNTNNNDSNASANAGAIAGSNSNANSSGGDGGSSSVTIEGDDFAASSAAPVYLTSSNDTCMGSSGVGGQGMSFGFSLGTTWTDSNCIMLKNARELKAQGHDKAAKARLCMDDDNAMAFELAGEPCPRALESSQAAVAKVREWNPEYMAASAAGKTPSRTQTAARRIVPASVYGQE